MENGKGHRMTDEHVGLCGSLARESSGWSARTKVLGIKGRKYTRVPHLGDA